MRNEYFSIFRNIFENLFLHEVRNVVAVRIAIKSIRGKIKIKSIFYFRRNFLRKKFFGSIRFALQKFFLLLKIIFAIQIFVKIARLFLRRKRGVRNCEAVQSFFGNAENAVSSFVVGNDVILAFVVLRNFFVKQNFSFLRRQEIQNRIFNGDCVLACVQNKLPWNRRHRAQLVWKNRNAFILFLLRVLRRFDFVQEKFKMRNFFSAKFRKFFFKRDEFVELFYAARKNVVRILRHRFFFDEKFRFETFRANPIVFYRGKRFCLANRVYRIFQLLVKFLRFKIKFVLKFFRFWQIFQPRIHKFFVWIRVLAKTFQFRAEPNERLHSRRIFPRNIMVERKRAHLRKRERAFKTILHFSKNQARASFSEHRSGARYKRNVVQSQFALDIRKIIFDFWNANGDAIPRKSFGIFAQDFQRGHSQFGAHRSVITRANFLLGIVCVALQMN